MEGALPFRVEHPSPGRRARAGGEARQVPLERNAQLLPTALGALFERDGAAGTEREQPTLDRVPAADEPAVKRQLRRPEGEERRAAEQLQLPSAAPPARADAAAGEALDRLPIGDTESAGTGLGRLGHGLRHEHPLARREAAGLEHALQRLPPGYAVHRHRRRLVWRPQAPGCPETFGLQATLSSDDIPARWRRRGI